jgi:Na+/melibiose symporter-like transporter
MIGEMILYAANRATSGAVENVTRKASWGGFAVFLLLAGTTFGLVSTFWWLTESFSPTVAALLIAIGCFAVGLVFSMMPRFLDWREARTKKPAEAVADTVNAVKTEVSDAVDYFGPLRVVASAFMLGLGIARTVRR